MTPERWQEVKRVFEEATERDPAEREAYLQSACRGDPDLRAEVESLLAADRDAGSRYDDPIVSSAPAQDPIIGRHVSAYKIVRRLGAGGMGAVYLASRDDDQFRRLVAIKLIRPELLDENTRRRFHNERQTLAALEHPNIVKLVDGGTTEDGWPYLIMDYVEGQPIDRYVKERDLPVAERLELFRTLCAAVHYAHQNLVVHRDLKPANILVTPQGVPKLLDFGIAKLLRPAFAQATVGFTRTNAQPMTPEYASPEQILGQPITTATDIYSLGVILYTLLTGSHPYQAPSQSYHELEVSICEGNPRKPSAALQSIAPSAARQLRGDLDTIVLTAMRKEPQRRYRSAEHLAEDVRRHLQDEPLAARPDTIWYRTQKFVARNRWTVAASAAVTIALASLAVADRIDRVRAERRFEDLRSFSNFVIQDLDKAVANGPTPARQVLSTKALQYLDSLAPEARGDTSLKLDLIGGYLKVAGIQGDLWQENVGDPSAARQSLDRALQIAATLRPSDLSNDAARALVAQCEEKMGDLLGPAGERAAALDHYAKALKMSQADLKGSVNLLTKIAGLQEDNGDLEAALESYRKAEPLARDYAAKNPNSQGARRGIAFVEEGIGRLAMLTGDPAASREAENAVNSAIAIYESGSQTPALRRNLAIAYKDLAEIQHGNGKAAAALENCRRAMSITEDLLAKDPQNEELSIDLAENRQLLIQLLLESGLRDEARKQTAAALARLRPLVQRDKPSIYYLAPYIGILDDTPFAELARRDDPVSAAQRYVEIVRDSESLDLLARALERDGRSAEAAKVEAEALAMLPPAKPGRPVPQNRRKLETRLTRMTAASAQAQHNSTAGRNQSQDPR